MIAGLVTQGVALFDASVASVWLHARAAETVVKAHGTQSSLLAGDLIAAIPTSYSELN